MEQKIEVMEELESMQSIQALMNECLEQRDYKKAERLIREYERSIEKKTPIQEQYIDMIKAIAYYLRKRKTDVACDELIEALEITSKDWNQEKWNWKFLSEQERRLLLLIPYIFMELGNLEEALQLLKKIENAIELCDIEEEETVIFYPACEYLLAKVYLQLRKMKKMYQSCQKGKECLLKNNTLTLLRELLQLELEYHIYELKLDEIKACKARLDSLALECERTEQNRNEEELLLLIKESIKRELS